MARKAHKSKGWHKFAWAAAEEKKKNKKCKYCGSTNSYHPSWCQEADTTKF